MLTDLRPLALMLGVSLLTGCAVGPDYRSPEIDASSRFLSQEAVAHRDAPRQADLDTWWTGFEDPLLTRFISLALEQNLDIAQATARIAQSRASLRLADAALLPSANVSANAARTHQSVETPLGQLLSAARGDRNGSYYEANLNASWE
jgi:outer membrane protein TolC